MSETDLKKQKKTNVIVLDFDGSLFPRRFFATGKGADPVLVEIIKQLCTVHGFKIVLSAVLQKDEEKAKETLIDAGLNPMWLWSVSWKTLDVGFLTGDRYRQIERWYEHYEDQIGELAIFEDEYCPMISPVSAFWYACDSTDGLKYHNVVDLYGKYDLTKEEQ